VTWSGRFDTKEALTSWSLYRMAYDSLAHDASNRVLSQALRFIQERDLRHHSSRGAWTALLHYSNGDWWEQLQMDMPWPMINRDLTDDS